MESSGHAGRIRTDVCLGCCCCVMLSPVQLFMTLWTVARQAPLSMGFSRQEYWRGLPFPSPREFPNPGIKPTSLVSPALTSGFFTIMPPGKPLSGLGKASDGVRHICCCWRPSFHSPLILFSPVFNWVLSTHTSYTSRESSPSLHSQRWTLACVHSSVPWTF